MIMRIHRKICALKYMRSYATSFTEPLTTAISTKTTPSRFFTQRFKKIRAYPFNVEPWHAKAFMDLVAGMMTTRLLPATLKVYLYVGIFLTHPDNGYVSKLYSKYLKYRFSKSGELPTDMKAVYYPSWRLWSAFQLGTAGRDGIITYHNVIRVDYHLPGTTLYPEITSTNGGYRPPVALIETSPLADCLNPFGMEVHCSPFTISPFAPSELAKSTPDGLSRLKLGDDVVLPSHSAIDIYAACPVMYPYYTAEYTYPANGEFKEEKFRLYVSAWDMHPLIGSLIKEIKVAEEPSFFDMEKLDGATKAKYLSTIPALRTDDDTCIRPMKKDELESLDRYTKLRKELNRMENMFSRTWPKSQQEEYFAQHKIMKKRIDSYKPSWWSTSSMAKFGSPRDGSKTPTTKSSRPAKHSRSRP